MLSGYRVRHLIVVWAISNVCGPSHSFWLWHGGHGGPWWGFTNYMPHIVLVNCKISFDGVCWSNAILDSLSIHPGIFFEFYLIYTFSLLELTLYISSSILLLTAFAFQHVTLH